MSDSDGDEPTAALPAASQVQPHALVVARLTASSQKFAQSAATAYSSEDWEVFHLHLATAVEQLVKAALAKAHPALLADPRAALDSLLHLCGLSAKANTPEWSGVRTIPIGEALVRAGRVVTGYRSPSDEITALLNSRNAIVHFGQHARAESEGILGAVANFAEPLLTSLGIDQAMYWGESAALVADHAAKRLTAVEAAYQRRLHAAKERYRSTVFSMEDAAQTAFLAAIEPTGPSEEFSSFPFACPACENMGTVYGMPEPEWEADWDVSDGEAYVSGGYVGEIRLRVTGFDCRACGLDLVGQLLEPAGLATATFGEDDFDIQAASDFFTPEYDDY